MIRNVVFSIEEQNEGIMWVKIIGDSMDFLLGSYLDMIEAGKI